MGLISENGLVIIICLQGWINSSKYIDMLSEHFARYFGRNLRNIFIFMQDNALIPRCFLFRFACSVTKRLFDRNCVTVYQVTARLGELWMKIKEKWGSSSSEFCRKLIQELQKNGYKLSNCKKGLYYKIVTSLFCFCSIFMMILFSMCI